MDLDRAKWLHDPEGFLAAIQAKAQLIGDGYAAGLEAAPPDLAAEGLLFAGMGGSGATAGLVKDACTRALHTPMTVVKHYQFPHHVKKSWHVLAVSYSGNTEETLAVAREAKSRGVPTTGFCCGGALPGLVDRVVAQPSRYQPRAALGHAWFSVLGFLEGAGILASHVPVDDAMAAVREVDVTCGPTVPEAENEAKQLARRLAEKIPQLYVTPAFASVGLWWRAMLNENAKKIADVDLVPECNHNDFTGWGGDPNREHFTVLTLSHDGQNPEIRKRLAFMEERYQSWGVPWHHRVSAPIHTMQEHIVEQARAIQLADYTSFYISQLRGQDPSAVHEIIALKEYLRS